MSTNNCTCDIWHQDYENVLLNNRFITHVEPFDNYIFPHVCDQTCVQSNMWANNRKSICIRSDFKNIRDITIESDLFSINKPIDRDQVPVSIIKQIDRQKKYSNHLLYQMYHTQEVNSPCYPNVDIHKWDNCTKAICTTIDTRK